MAIRLQIPIGNIIRIVATALLLCAWIGLSARDGLPDRAQTSQARGTARIVIPNIDDDNGDGLPDFQANSTDRAVDDDLLPILIKPAVALSEGAVLRVDVPKPWAESVKILMTDASGKMFQPVHDPLRLDPVDAFRNGVRLAVEGGAFAGPGRPRDIAIGFRFETKDGTLVSNEVVAFTVAPFMMSCCLDPADAVHVVRVKSTEPFVSDLGPAVQAAGARLLAFENAAIPEHDIWFQDATEIGYAIDGSRVMRVPPRQPEARARRPLCQSVLG